jgi:hypothetical protein
MSGILESVVSKGFVGIADTELALAVFVGTRARELALAKLKPDADVIVLVA